MPIRLLLLEILGKLSFEWLTISEIGMILNKKAWAKNFNTRVGAKWGPAEWNYRYHDQADQNYVWLGHLSMDNVASII